MGIVAAADCNSFSVGMDSGHYEGPLRMRLPVKLSPGVSAEGAWSFEIPLPDPASQKLLSRCALLAGFSLAVSVTAAQRLRFQLLSSRRLCLVMGQEMDSRRSLTG